MKNLLKKLYDYYPIIKEDEDWDYGFLLDLIEFKLKRMIKHFRETPQILENQLRYARQMEVALNILHAGYKADIVTEEDLYPIYVNSRNVHRFLHPKEMEFLVEHSNLNQYYLPTLREAKAKKLFWKYMEHYIENWWT